MTIWYPLKEEGGMKMGKTGRAKKHEDRMKQKRALKAAKKAKYLALAGTSKKSKNCAKRARALGAKEKNYKHAHRVANCGNVGCKRCFPR